MLDAISLSDGGHSLFLVLLHICVEDSYRTLMAFYLIGHQIKT
jgi:hypothetical protein